MPFRLLVVDDDPDLARILVDVLTACDFDCRRAVSGEEALQSLSQRPLPQVVLLDVMLPGMSGLQVLKTMRTEPELKSVPVVMISTLTDRKTVAAAKALGAADYIAKPFDPADLTKRVLAALSPTA